MALLANDMHFFMSNAQKVFKLESAMINLVPYFPTRALGSGQIIHHAHSNAIDFSWKRNATVTTQPIFKIMQQLVHVKANVFHIAVRHDLRLLEIGDYK